MANWTSGATGALSGASTGATVGSIFPGPGTAIGAGVGGLVGGIAGLFGSKKKKKKRLSTFDKRQQQLNEQQHDSILGKGPLADLYNYDPEKANAVFDQNIARPQYRDLEEKGIPSLTGQFRKQGLMNSSYAGDAVGRLIRDVQEKVTGERSKYLYDEQKDARTAKRGAVEKLQDRNTFDWDAGGKGFDISKVLDSITPEMKKEFTDYFKKKPAATATGGTT